MELHSNFTSLVRASPVICLQQQTKISGASGRPTSHGKGIFVSNSSTHLVVIGAGPGGYAAAFLAADLGMAVTLIDEDTNPGGVCLYRGCIPSKALLHAAKVLSEAREAKNFGVDFPEPKIHLDQLRQWKNNVVGRMTSGLGVLVKQRKIQYIRGKARFLNSSSLQINETSGSVTQLNFATAILATGSRPILLPNLPASDRIMDSTSALEIKDIPQSLLVVGGGYIGLELGTVYAQLGSKITVVEMTPGLIPGADRDVVQILSRQVEKIFSNMMLNTKVTGMATTDSGIKVTFEQEDGQKKAAEFSKVLIAIGRKPNTQDLGLEHTKIQLDSRQFVKVSPTRQTTDKNIYAIGDIAGEPMLAHKASHEGRIAVEAIAGHKVAFEPQAIPAVVFTDPEIAWCGLTETQAAKENRPVKVAKFPWGASGRAVTLDRPEGLTKLIIDPATERVLGMVVVGTGAGELIAEGVLAVEMGSVVSDIKLSIHPHPTLSETIMESAESFFGQSTHIYRPIQK